MTMYDWRTKEQGLALPEKPNGRWAPQVNVVRIASEPIEVSFTAAADTTIRHDLGQPVSGYVVIWSDAPVDVHVTDPAAPTHTELVLHSTTTAAARLILLT